MNSSWWLDRNRGVPKSEAMASHVLFLMIPIILVSVALGFLAHLGLHAKTVAGQTSRMASLRSELAATRRRAEASDRSREDLASHLEDLLLGTLADATSTGINGRLPVAFGIARTEACGTHHHEEWRATRYGSTQPQYEPCSSMDRIVLRHMRTPATLENAANSLGIGIRMMRDTIATLLRQERLAQIGERYVTTHEGHIHGLMTVTEAVIYRRIMGSTTKRIVIDGTWGPHDRNMTAIMGSLGSLTERRYLCRIGPGVYDLVPIPLP